MQTIKPPNLKEILARHFEDITQLQAHATPIDDKGRYLPWPEFRYRYQRPEIEWAAVKIARQAIMAVLPLYDTQGQPFQYAIPYSFQGRLHQVDRLATPLLAERQQDNLAFFTQSLTEEAISSAQLEGASTTRQAAKEMLDNQRQPQNEHERMISNNYALMRHVTNTSQEPLSLELIKSYHAIAVNQTNNPYITAGEFRTDNQIFVQDAEGNIAHQPPPYEQIPQRLQALCDFANTDHNQEQQFIPPVVKAIILHFMMGYEHPFADGNGRTARAIFYWYMLKAGYSAFEFISISALLKKAPKQYGLAYLYSETDDNDLTYFIDYQLNIISRAISRFSQYINQRQQQHQTLMQWLLSSNTGQALNERQADIVSKAIKHTGRAFTVKEIMADYQISENSARTDLKGLANIGVLAEAQHKGRLKIYIAMPDIESRLTGKKR